jgi:hypothetical protein
VNVAIASGRKKLLFDTSAYHVSEEERQLSTDITGTLID